MRARRAIVATLAALLMLGAAAPAASGHASLVRTAPERGAELAEPPSEVSFTFNEPVELSFGALRVFDAEGAEVQSGEPTHPDGRDEEIAVALPEGLGDGSYTVTYRVVSADGHPISGGFVFSVGPGSAAPAASVSELIDSGDSGAATDIGFAAARVISYLAIALALGGALFLVAVWGPALSRVAGSGGEWLEASRRFGDRVRGLLALAVGLGIAGTAAGIVLQGAVASGQGALDALDPDVIGDVLETRFGVVWAARLAIWAVIGAVLGALVWRKGPLPALRPATLGASGTALERPARAALLAGGALLVALAATPALAGHAASQGPALVLVPSTIVHVVAMSAWVGGLAFLVAALPAATRTLEPPDRSRLLAASLLRFSPLALAAVIALLATGTLQSLLELDSLGALFDTAFGRLILVKASLLAVLVGLGAYNRRRSLPQMAELAERGSAPGGIGMALRRVLRTEVALVAAAIVATSFLVAQTPTAEGGGPASGSTELGDARLDYTVDPAQPGANEIHLYLTDAETGTPSEVRSANASASQAEREIGPIEIELERTGPGHFTAPAAALGVSGEWTIELRALVSRFDQLEGSFEVDVE